MRVCIETHGCRTNLADSSRLAEALAARGAELVELRAEADVVVVNSCTVTAGADRDAARALHRARREAKGALCVLVGCLPAAHGEHRVLGLADLVVAGCDPDEIARRILASRSPLPISLATLSAPTGRELAREALDSPGLPAGLPWGRDCRACAPSIAEPVPSCSSFPLERVLALSRVNIKIQEGCDGGCAYCIVPRARGRPRSLPAAGVLARISAAADAGFAEVVLTGTNLAKYGRDLEGGPSLAALMDAVAGMAPACRVRVSSVEPDEGLAEVVARLARHGVFCRHLHVPLQHASDEVLHAMGREGAFARVAETLGEARRLMPDLGVGADVIVGFPGETEEAFAECVERLERLPLAYLHVFAFSPRPGTASERLAGRPEPGVVRSRSERLRRLSARRRAEFVRSLVGERVEVVVERRRDERSGYLIGLSSSFVRALVAGDDELMGRRLAGEVTAAGNGVLMVRPDGACEEGCDVA